jgi:hypothetical protein
MVCGGFTPAKTSSVESDQIIDRNVATVSSGKDQGHISSLVRPAPQELSSPLTALTQISIDNAGKTSHAYRGPIMSPLARPLGNARGYPMSPMPETDNPLFLVEPIATSRKSSVRPRPPSRQIFSRSKSPPLEPLTEADANQESDEMDFIARPLTPLTPLTERAASPTKSYFSSPASQSPQNAILNDLVRSPISPLFFNSYTPFAPQFSNTPHRNTDGFQRSQPRADTGSMGPSTQQPMMFNSQFDVDRHIADFDAFMADDVGVHVDSGGNGGKFIDLDGWIDDDVVSDR